MCADSVEMLITTRQVRRLGIVMSYDLGNLNLGGGAKKKRTYLYVGIAVAAVVVVVVALFAFRVI